MRIFVSIPNFTEAEIRSQSIVAGMARALVNTQCTLINIYEKVVQLKQHGSGLAAQLTIAVTPISTEYIPSITTAVVGANDVMAILNTLMCSFQTFVPV